MTKNTQTKTSNEPFFSIVIPVRKIGQYVLDHIPKLLDLSYKNFEIIIVSEAKETYTFPNTTILKVDRVNPATKRNVGAQAARGDIVAFIDDDAYPVADWLDHAIPYFENPDICAVAGPQLAPKESTFKQMVSGFVYALGAGSQKYVYTKDKFQYIVDYPTCNLLVRKKDFESIKGFNTYYWGGEDTKLCYDLTQKLKKKMVYDPNVIVYHHRRKTYQDHLRQTYMWSLYRGYFSRKFPETSRKLVYFLPLIFYVGVLLGPLTFMLHNSFKTFYFVVLALYALYSIFTAAKTKSFAYFIPVLFLLIATHMTYAYGVFAGILRNKSLDKTFNPAEALEIE